MEPCAHHGQCEQGCSIIDRIHTGTTGKRVTRMRHTVAVVLITLVATSTLAHDRTRLNALEERLKTLEAKVSELEASTAPAVAKVNVEQVVQAQRIKARNRMRKDRSVYSGEQLREIEDLYQVANRKWRSQEGKDSLKRLIARYDKANRTGCALLYLGQMTKGSEQLDYLNQAIAKHGGCYYGNGVNVGAYARFYRAMRYKKEGKEKEATKLFGEILTRYPNAIYHKGKLLSFHIKGLE